MGKNRLKFPFKVLDEVVHTVNAYADQTFIVGYRFSSEESETPGISVEITEALVKTLIEKLLDYLQASLMDVEAETRESNYQGEGRVKVLR